MTRRHRPPRIPSVPWLAYSAVRTAVQACGHRVPAEVAPVRGHVPMAAFDALFAALERARVPAQVVLDLAAAMPAGALGNLDLAMMAAPTVADALRALTWGWHLVASRGELLTLERRDGGALRIAILHASRATEDPHSDALAAAVLVGRLRHHAGTPPRLSAVALGLTANERGRRCFQDYFGCPVVFGAAHTFVEWQAGSARLRQRGADRSAFLYLCRRLRQADGAPVFRVMAGIRAWLSRGADLADVARACGWHPRTLQRRVGEHGWGWRELRDHVRCDEAHHLLAVDGLPLEGVAQALGFADHASFSRAFLRWTGRTPSRVRRQVQGRKHR